MLLNWFVCREISAEPKRFVLIAGFLSRVDARQYVDLIHDLGYMAGNYIVKRIDSEEMLLNVLDGKEE